MVKKYWKDPKEGRNSGFVGEVVATEEEGTMKIVLEGKTDTLVVCPTEICEVLTSMEGVELNWLIEQPSFDKAYYIHHLGGAEFHYRGFTLSVFGDQSIFLNGKELISDCPELLLEFQGELSFGENAWVEIIQDEDFDREYPTCSTFKEATDEVDNMLGCEYDVRVELLVKTGEFCTVKVVAGSHDEATAEAVRRYQESPDKYETWTGETIETTIDTSAMGSWEVEKCEKGIKNG